MRREGRASGWMAEFKGTSFAGERIILDDNSYVQCIFNRCEIVYAARGKVHLDGCTFGNCSYTLDGPAQETLLFLTALYQIDPAAVEATFQNIRSGAQPVKPPPRRPA